MSLDRNSYRKNWVEYVREVARVAAEGLDGAHLKPLPEQAQKRWVTPETKGKAETEVLIAFNAVVRAYAMQTSGVARAGLKDAVLAWAGRCAEILGVPLAETQRRERADLDG